MPAQLIQKTKFVLINVGTAASSNLCLRFGMPPLQKLTHQKKNLLASFSHPHHRTLHCLEGTTPLVLEKYLTHMKPNGAPHKQEYSMR